MRTSFTNSFGLLLLIFLFSSCASSYKTLQPETMRYEAKHEDNNVVLEYKLGVLAEYGNKKYAKKEHKTFVKVAAVKLTNNTAYTLDINNDVRFFSGPNQFTPLEPTLAHSRLKQGVPIYLLYLLLTPSKITNETYVNGLKTEDKSIRIGYVLGPAITLYNILRASNANKNMLHNLQTNNLYGRQVAAGETVYGLVVIPNGSYNPLQIKVGPQE